jgi:hypothetical protein
MKWFGVAPFIKQKLVTEDVFVKGVGKTRSRRREEADF